MNSKVNDCGEVTKCGGHVNYTTDEKDLVTYTRFAGCQAGGACQGCSWINICPEAVAARAKKHVDLMTEARNLGLTVDAQDPIADLQRMIITKRLANEKKLEDQRDRQAEKMASIYNLACFETTCIEPGWNFTRVPGGWISTTARTGVEVFIPYNFEFKPSA
jgi:hypothetical protein